MGLLILLGTLAIIAFGIIMVIPNKEKPIIYPDEFYENLQYFKINFEKIYAVKKDESTEIIYVGETQNKAEKFFTRVQMGFEEWLEKNEVNVIVRNLGIQSRPNGKKNPIWKMITSVMSSLYELELENILERTSVGRMVYVQNGGILGRPIGERETELKFISKTRNQKALDFIKKGWSMREISKQLDMSTKTISKVKTTALKLGMIENT
jgi:hypothetical protein